MFAIAYPPYIREKARELRVSRELTIDEIAVRLAISRSTVFHWVRDLPIPRSGSGGGFLRSWRSRYGVLTVTVGDTYLRARLQAWIDCLREIWD